MELRKRGAARHVVAPQEDESKPGRTRYTKNLVFRAVSAATLSWLAISLAHAGYIMMDTNIERRWHQYGTANPIFATVEEAYADTKARSEGCNVSKTTCWTL